MSENIEAKCPMPPAIPSMTAPTLMQRLCELKHQKVNVYLNCEEVTAPVTGMLHAVGQDYIEVHNGNQNHTQSTIIPMMNICAVNVAGAMDNICPPPQYPVSPGQDQMPCMPPGGGMGPGMGGGMGPGMGGGYMPGCPMPGGHPGGYCPPPTTPPGCHGPMPGMMDVKDVKDEEKE